MQLLQNYAMGQWASGTEKGDILLDASTGDPIASISSAGLDFGSMLAYGRTTGGKILRKMTFQQRGLMLKALAMYLLERKDKYYKISFSNRSYQNRQLDRY